MNSTSRFSGRTLTSFIRAKVSDTIRRIRRFFGEDVAGYHQLNAMKDSLARRIEIEKDQFTTLEDLQQFFATRGNNILLTQPKAVMVLDPEQDLAALFEELVADPKKPLTVQAAIPLRKRLGAFLMDQVVRRYIRTKLDIEAPALRETLHIPYAFQNGRLISFARLSSSISPSQRANRRLQARCRGPHDSQAQAPNLRRHATACRGRFL
ncbi:MAG TPA: hypothetical protein VHP11_04680 [Tepidisphaeraceae bacterium]|nr:hypothetical protein [Tepidisphaeraceae bacterium]